ncbi:acetyl/propionyl/methylcrotonyl-CoA carboxylase subunit alpha [Nocardiopsis alba]|uniref:biotin carboxylase n=1 Tax=Nocardiopsis alba TaxID=53437 RepID=A0A7K2INY2_9ACTN|nr:MULTISPECIES: acetyl-CoA carboxylase biotin carboxylase subunit [Nocardiopsis]MEC3894064.1 acetyl-CoA carboxylase biotin carboxylase subunit [Nocardiopsis sp. LDBS1602]MYR31679.1 acetyl-CoA carboxylase biotin carboxylase subunit [Nocardiopsis alba]
MFKRLLVANRGEIAVRIVRTCRELGIESVVVYSTEDRDSTAVRLADQAVHIGPAEAKRSYLHAPSILEAALATGAEAVHPGYGFLSEDADFADACAAVGLAFVGPSSEVMYRLADKSAARLLMAEAGLPVLPGSPGPVSTATEVKEAVGLSGYPLMLKAAAGGGGRGITVVREPEDLDASLRSTRAQAQALYGNDDVYVERLVEGARHVEVQVLADRHDAVVHLGERDCSVQRRHQKLVEETPAPNLPPELLEEIREAAVRGARAVGYEGAGTLEFLVDPKGRYYFMEINCRLQVEHPVTEMVTGVDLVAEQIRVASGEPLSFRQEDVRPIGVAMECRVNAEHPERGFLPTAGTLDRFEVPGGAFVRVDTHAYPGWRISASYDSLVAKVSTWGPDRETCVRRMRRALSELVAEGPGLHTTADYLGRLLGHEAFSRAEHTVAFVDMITESDHGRA